MSDRRNSRQESSELELNLGDTYSIQRCSQGEVIRGVRYVGSIKSNESNPHEDLYVFSDVVMQVDQGLRRVILMQASKTQRLENGVLTYHGEGSSDLQFFQDVLGEGPELASNVTSQITKKYPHVAVLRILGMLNGEKYNEADYLLDMIVDPEGMKHGLDISGVSIEDFILEHQKLYETGIQKKKEVGLDVSEYRSWQEIVESKFMLEDRED